MYAVKWASVKDNRPKPYADDWQQFVKLLSNHVERFDKYDGYLYSPVTYKENGFRGNANVIAINAFVADLDGEELDDCLNILEGYEYITYTTYSHTFDEQHWHIVIPFAEPVPSHEWYSVWKQMHELLGITGDPQTCDPARIFFAPQHAPEAEFETIRGTGQLMQAPAQRYSDRPIVSKKPAAPRHSETDWDCTCTDAKRCRKCEIDFLDVDLSRYNGKDIKEIRADIRAEFLQFRAFHQV